MIHFLNSSISLVWIYVQRQNVFFVVVLHCSAFILSVSIPHYGQKRWRRYVFHSNTVADKEADQRKEVRHRRWTPSGPFLHVLDGLLVICCNVMLVRCRMFTALEVKTMACSQIQYR